MDETDEITVIYNSNEALSYLENTLRPSPGIIIEDLQKKFDEQLVKISLINDFMSMFGKRKEIGTDLTDLKHKTEELKMFVAEARNSINIFKTVQLPQTNLIIKNMREQHLEMLQALENLDEINNSKILLSDGIDVMPKLHKPPSADRNMLHHELHHQNKFDYHINPDEFKKSQKVCKYKCTLDEVSSFLQDVVIKCFVEKYTLICRNRRSVPIKDMKRWSKYQSQIEYFPNETFITEGDIATLIKKEIDQKMGNQISVLIGLGVIMERKKAIKNDSIKCYIWSSEK